MSLLGNRGRFTSEKNNNDLNNVNSDSTLSLIGKNPTKLFKIQVEKEQYDLKERLKKAKLENVVEKPKLTTHEEYNLKIEKQNKDFNDKYSDNYFKKDNYTKRKSSKKLIIAMVLVELISLFCIYGVGIAIRLKKSMPPIVIDKEKVIPDYLPEDTVTIMKGYKTVALFGLDSRTGSVDKGNNADVNKIINLNLQTGEVQIVNLLRDTYLNISDNNTYDKLNAAYRIGGPEAAIKAINKNFDLTIENFFSFSWKAVADAIELLGGVDLEITSAENKYMNAFIHETCVSTGIDAKNPKGHYISGPGMQHLDGVQAVAYARLRLMDSDFKRTERQTKVMKLAFEKAKNLDIPNLIQISEAILPQIAYDYPAGEIVSIIKLITQINIVDSFDCPDVNSLVSMNMGSSGNCLVPTNLERSVTKLHKELFNEEDYKASKAVKSYSNRILELRNKYVEENLINESIKQSSIEESLNKPVSKSSKSNASSNKPKSSISTNSTVKKVENAPFGASVSNNQSDGSNIEEPESDPVINKPPYSNETVENYKPAPNGPVSSESISGPYPISNNNNSTNQSNMPVQGAPGGSSSNQGVVISGPPTGNIIESNNSNNNTSNMPFAPVNTPY